MQLITVVLVQVLKTLHPLPETISGQNVSLSHVRFDILGDYYACRCPQDDVDRPQ